MGTVIEWQGCDRIRTYVEFIKFERRAKRKEDMCIYQTEIYVLVPVIYPGYWFCAIHSLQSQLGQ